MPVNKKYLAEFVPEHYYHIYNRTNNKEPLFQDDEDRESFLTSFNEYLHPYVEICCYCLMDNHFHIMVKTRPLKDIERWLNESETRDLRIVQLNFLLAENKEELYNQLIVQQFKKLFIRYTMAFNARHERHGNLFGRSFKRVLLDDINVVKYVYFYIHANPMKSGISDNFSDYKWSSYAYIIKKNSEFITVMASLSAFRGTKTFINYHNKQLKNSSLEQSLTAIYEP